MTQRWKITIEYDGTDYCGWQRQDVAMSVQQAIEESIYNFCGENVEIFTAGRTDAGVHAIGQVAHFDLERVSTVKDVRDAINHHLKDHKISILEAEQVSSEFHARFHALKRIYCYRILANRKADSVLNNKYLWYVKYDLDIKSMHEASQYLLGLHDFSSFRAAECQAKTPMRSIDKISVEEIINPLIPVGKYIEIWVEARSFLHHQVRNIVGTLYDIGRGKLSPEDMKLILEAKDRKKAGVTAPAQGLYFVRVEY